MESSCLSNITNPNQSNNFKIFNVSCILSKILIGTAWTLSAFFSTGTSWYQPERKCMFEHTDDAACNLSNSNTMSSEILTKSVFNHCFFSFNRKLLIVLHPRASRRCIRKFQFNVINNWIVFTKYFNRYLYCFVNILQHYGTLLFNLQLSLH